MKIKRICHCGNADEFYVKYINKKYKKISLSTALEFINVLELNRIKLDIHSTQRHPVLIYSKKK